MVAGECALKLAISKMKGTRCDVGSLGKRKVVEQLFGSAPRAWRRARQAATHSAATPTGRVAAVRVRKKMTPEGGLGRSGRVDRMPLGPAQRENQKKRDGPQEGLGRNDFGLR
jgi:hypothetical protein